MEEKTSGIVISAVNYGENDKILNVFTLEKGMVSARIKGVKKAGAKLKFASQPFCFSEYIFSVSGDKRSVINASLIDSFYPIREDVIKYYSAGAMVEFVKRFFREEMISQNTFMALCNGLKEIAYGTTSCQEVCAKFIYEALKTVGYGLNVAPFCECGEEIDGRVFFNYNSAGFHCQECATVYDREISIVTFNALLKMEDGESLENVQTSKVLRLLDFYLQAKAEVKLNSLVELIAMQSK